MDPTLAIFLPNQRFGENMPPGMTTLNKLPIGSSKWKY